MLIISVKLNGSYIHSLIFLLLIQPIYQTTAPEIISPEHLPSVVGIFRQTCWVAELWSIFFLCLCSLSPLSRLRERARGIEREGEKTSLTEAQSIISQVFDWSDCKRSRQFPRVLDWDELELARNKTQFSRSEETAVLNKTRQRMQKNRHPAEDKVESWLLLFPLPPFPCYTKPII